MLPGLLALAEDGGCDVVCVLEVCEGWCGSEEVFLAGGDELDVWVGGEEGAVVVADRTEKSNASVT